MYFPGNCYDANQYPGYSLYCPYAYRLPNGTILAKDLAAEYNYLGNSSIWFYDARTKAQEIIDKNSPIYRGYVIIFFASHIVYYIISFYNLYNGRVFSFLLLFLPYQFFLNKHFVRFCFLPSQNHFRLPCQEHSHLSNGAKK